MPVVAGMATTAGTVTMAGIVITAGTVIMAGMVTMAGTVVGMFLPSTAGAGAGPSVAIESSALPRHTAHAGIAYQFANNTNRKILHFV